MFNWLYKKFKSKYKEDLKEILKENMIEAKKEVEQKIFDIFESIVFEDERKIKEIIKYRHSYLSTIEERDRIAVNVWFNQDEAKEMPNKIRNKIGRLIELHSKKSMKEALDSEYKKIVNEIESRLALYNAESFIDGVVERINKKQLNK